MPRGLTLLIDADDTLWENNIYFEKVIASFCELLEVRGREREAARRTLNAIERVRTKANGYGVKNFQASLGQTCAQMLAGEDHTRELEQVADLCAALARQPPTLLPGVADTLRELAGRHRLILFTKGDIDDQLGKVQRSGLGGLLHQIDVVREKDVETYRDAVARHGISPTRAWMIGNSPRSDIMPALEAGLGAVFIPHESTWELELGEVPADGEHDRLLILDRFAELLKHF
jgi:putative hydrolase of the HAD superfamily